MKGTLPTACCISFRRLNEALEGVFDLREVACMTYIDPFYHVIVSKERVVLLLALLELSEQVCNVWIFEPSLSWGRKRYS